MRESSIGYGAKTELVRSTPMTDFDPPETPIHIESDQARGGETSGRVRYVLAISVALAVIILSLIVWAPLLFQK